MRAERSNPLFGADLRSLITDVDRTILEGDLGAAMYPDGGDDGEEEEGDDGEGGDEEDNDDPEELGDNSRRECLGRGAYRLTCESAVDEEDGALPLCCWVGHGEAVHFDGGSLSGLTGGMCFPRPPRWDRCPLNDRERGALGLREAFPDGTWASADEMDSDEEELQRQRR